MFFLISCSSFIPESDTGSFYRFQAKNGKSIYVNFINIKKKEYVDIRIGNGMRIELKGKRSGSEARYSNGKYVLWNKGNKIMILLKNEVIFEGQEVNEF